MVLTAGELTGKNIVHGRVAAGQRATTYDATVGSIIRCGVEIDAQKVVLKPRQIIWVVSAETFAMGNATTGLATLKTQWTHRGVLALNVGVVDPGWNGPLAAAVVNFSSSDFVIEKGKPFFRILFHGHTPIPANELQPLSFSHEAYLAQVTGYSRSFSTTFLDMDDLTRTVADKVLGLPRWGLILSLVAIVIGLLSITIPVGVAIWTDGSGDKARIAALEAKVDRLQEPSTPQIDPATCRTGEIANQVRLICPQPLLH